MGTAKMINETIKFTYKDYLHLPEDKKYEIIEGALNMVPSPNREHQDVSWNINQIKFEEVF